MATVLLQTVHTISGASPRSLTELISGPALCLYNTEAHGAIHEALSALPGYVSSEYFGAELRSGDRHESGILHQDLQNLSFSDGSFDLVVSTDVLEHVPDPYTAHREVHRVLREGGHHVFTVPYLQGAALDEVRAVREPDGSVRHLLPALYHADPLRPAEGALVFTVFGLEMVSKLARIGFDTRVIHLYDPECGLVGADGIVFDATKR